jgi:hypothetical protein
VQDVYVSGFDSGLGIGARREILMLVKTYPVPSNRYGETVCCAGIDTATGEWLRVYPVNFRFLPYFRQFKKWQLITAEWSPPTGDSRPESIRVAQETIQLGQHLPAGTGWARRREWLDPLVIGSLEELRDSGGSLGVIRPRSIDDFVIEPAEDWDEASTADLAQLRLDLGGGQASVTTGLEPIPWNFRYRFHCRNDACGGHNMEIFDWEIGQAYRNFLATYGESGWREKLREQYLERLPSRDIHLMLGTHHRFGSWMIIGVVSPPHV